MLRICSLLGEGFREPIAQSRQAFGFAVLEGFAAVITQDALGGGFHFGQRK